jgi:mannose/fructose/N-acetylgalactosamine-specific phosphotransferase system component IIC
MGATVGIILELFALEVLPVGAAKYPDYGLGAVSGVAAAAGAPAILGTGVGVAVGLVVAYVSGRAIHLVRIKNGGDVERYQSQLDAGVAKMVVRLHLRCLGRDAIRSFMVVTFGVLLAWAVRHWAPFNVQGAVYLGIVTLGAAIAASIMGVIRLAGQKSVQRWFVLGLIGGLVGVILS